MRYLLLVAGLFIASGAAADDRFYVAGSAGALFRQPRTFDTVFDVALPALASPGTSRNTYDTGFVANAAVGLAIGSHVRLEDEAGYGENFIGTVQPRASGSLLPQLDGQTYTRTSGGRGLRITDSVNAFYDFGGRERALRPFVGAGLGVDWVRSRAGYFDNAIGRMFVERAGDNGGQGFALVEAGVSIRLTRRLSLVPAFRYTHSFTGNDDSDHIAKLGLRYRFS